MSVGATLRKNLQVQRNERSRPDGSPIPLSAFFIIQNRCSALILFLISCHARLSSRDSLKVPQRVLSLLLASRGLVLLVVPTPASLIFIFPAAHQCSTSPRSSSWRFIG